jgi:toxin ParE1/3/4
VRKYRLSKAADKDLSGIYAYTHREFGQRQADAYFESLEESLSRLGENPLLGVDVSTIREGYRRLVHQEHSIYYKSSESGILIVRILGPGMAAERHLP